MAFLIKTFLHTTVWCPKKVQTDFQIPFFKKLRPSFHDGNEKIGKSINQTKGGAKVYGVYCKQPPPQQRRSQSAVDRMAFGIKVNKSRHERATKIRILSTCPTKTRSSNIYIVFGNNNSEIIFCLFTLLTYLARKVLRSTSYPLLRQKKRSYQSEKSLLSLENTLITAKGPVMKKYHLLWAPSKIKLRKMILYVPLHIVYGLSCSKAPPPIGI